MKNLATIGITIYLFLSFSCSDTTNMSKSENNNKSLKSTQTISDRDLYNIANKHNEYLELIVESYNFNNSNSYQELERAFLQTNLPDLSLNDKNYIIDNIANKYLNENRDEIIDIATTDELIMRIHKENFINVASMIAVIQEAEQFATRENVNFSTLSQYIHQKLNYVSFSFQQKEQIVLKSFLLTLKNSAYFWFPTDKGGTGIGYNFLSQIAQAENRPIPWYGAALISDATSLSFGMVGVAVAGAFTPVGPLALAIVAGEAAFNSGVAGLIAS